MLGIKSLERWRMIGFVSLMTMVVAMLFACSSQKSKSCEPGELGCACRVDSSCDSGLTCDSAQVCSAQGGEGGVGGSEGNAGGQIDTGGSAGETEHGGGGSGGTPFAECSGYDLSTDGVLDLDLRAIHVTGAVTLNGAALPAAGGSRGQIAFVDSKHETQAAYDLGSTGAGTYALTIPPGKYEIQFLGNPKECAGVDTPEPEVPCSGGTLMTEIDLQADGVLNLDIPVAHLSGAVTLRGAPFPADTMDRGALQFVGSNRVSVVTKTFGMSGAVSYSVSLFPGKYDINFFGNPELCKGATPSAVPCNIGVVKSGVDVVTGVLDVDVGAVQVTGAVTLAGGVLPDELSTRGALSFNLNGYSVVSRDFGPSGAASYAVTLLPGTYKIAFVGNSQLCTGDQPSHVPCNDGVLFPATGLSADGVLNVDLKAVTIGGTVTLNGMPFPTQAGDRGALRFEGDTSSVVSKSFGASGAASYQITLLSGNYDVLFEANSTLCDANAESAAPCVSGKLLGAQSLSSNGNLDLDVPSIRVSGAVTVNGALPGDEIAPRGKLLFALADGGSVTSSFSSTGPVSYGLTLMPGTYALQFEANSALCGGVTVPQIPCIGGTLIASTSLTADGVLPIDIPSRSITGAVTLLGAPLPAEAQSRGSISFTRLDPAGPSSASAGDLQPAGAGAYGIAVLPGHYVITHQANPMLCGPGLVAQVPCASQVILGCE